MAVPCDTLRVLVTMPSWISLPPQCRSSARLMLSWLLIGLFFFIVPSTSHNSNGRQLVSSGGGKWSFFLFFLSIDKCMKRRRRRRRRRRRGRGEKGSLKWSKRVHQSRRLRWDARVDMTFEKRINPLLAHPLHYAPPFVLLALHTTQRSVGRSHQQLTVTAAAVQFSRSYHLSSAP